MPIGLWHSAKSTTFGVTLNPEDRPWPELLERMIQERLDLLGQCR